MSLLNQLKRTKEQETDTVLTASEIKKLGIYDVLTIYRGETEHSTPYTKALSWTLDKEVANSFANTYDSEEHFIYKAKVSASDIRAYDNRRGEKEIITHSDDLMEVELVFIY